MHAGNVCWKTDLGGPCLGNTPIASAGVSLNGTFGQASFDYSDVLDVGTSFLAVAAYQGSLLCKAAASDNADQPPPQGMFMVWCHNTLSAFKLLEASSMAAMSCMHKAAYNR